MKSFIQVLQIAFTYIGTIVGAGFASGQEILQFFTQYGRLGTVTIIFSSLMMVWLGTKMMLTAKDIGAKSYEDMNKHLFGEKIGQGVSIFILVTLFCIAAVMLAGAGSIFEEHLELPYQLGLVLTVVVSYFVLLKGMDAIITVNTIVVPVMLVFTAVVVISNINNPTAGQFLTLTTDTSPIRAWIAPFLYASFNLALAQAVLVPLGSTIESRKVIKWGGICGGLGIGTMLFSGHFAMSANMPGVLQFEIPMGTIVFHLGSSIQLLFLLVIFAEIFTTFIAEVYGLTLQLQQRISIAPKWIIITILILTYLVSQIGFKSLLSTLYPLFGMISMVWFVMMVWQRKTA
jgi:uncharacterized membrane protein YkvI